MFDNQAFGKLVEGGAATGEVVGVNQLLVQVRGLDGASTNSLVMFENGGQGLVRSINDRMVEILSFNREEVPIGTLAALKSADFCTAVGEAFVGRVVNVAGVPLDGKGPIAASQEAAVFGAAPPIIERQELKDQLVSGVTIVDALFPIVKGQRIAVLGDNKSGKSTFLRQLTRYQAAAGQIVIYVLIAKRQVDVNTLVSDLEASGAIKHCIVVVASSFDSLSQAYLAPYVACAMGEHLWEQGKDVVVIYDDLSTHAKIYRELSLLAEVSPGRDSYPGDMFYAHSSLLERAGRLAKTGGTLTALPVVLTPGDDITAYLPTSIMSITDGQIIFDLKAFRQNIRPAVNVGLSVSRVGGRAQTPAWKQLTGLLFRKLADYHRAAEFAQFGTELGLESQTDLALGKLIYDVFKQAPGELNDLMTQYLVLACVLAAGGRTSLNVSLLKQKAQELAPQITATTDLEATTRQLLASVAIQIKPGVS